MLHDVSLITTLSAALGLALLFGFVAVRLGLPALIGYLIAGIIIGPHTPGFVANQGLASQLAEIGVMLLMFGVGLHFSFADLLSVRRIALPGAIVQIAAATLMGMGFATWWGWDWMSSMIFGLCLSVASTVVMLKALESRGVLQSVNGRIAIGWLVVEDLVMVLMLVLLPPLVEIYQGKSAGGSMVLSLAITLGKVGLFVLFMLLVGKRLFPWLLWQVAKTGSRELFTLCVIAAAVGIAYGSSALFGVSFALGAFFAGMVLRESDFSLRAAEESLPLQDAFSVLFFVSVGMLFDPLVLFEMPIQLLAVVLIIVAGKSLAAFLLVLLFRYPLRTALTVSASLAQIGEFSFILAGLGVALGALPQQGYSLVIAGALISIALNPFVFSTIDPVQSWFKKQVRKSNLFAYLLRHSDPLRGLAGQVDRGHLVIVGYGGVGARIGSALAEKQRSYVVIENNREVANRLRKQGVAAIVGDASVESTLREAGIETASMLVIAIPDTFSVRQILDKAREINPQIEAVIRAQSEEEAKLLCNCATGCGVFLAEEELARSMIRFIEGESAQ